MLAPIIRIALSLLLIQLLGAFRSQYHGIASPLSFTKCSLNGRTFKANDPLVGEIIHVKKLVSNSYGEVCEVLINHFEQMDFVEGQSIGIIPPGINPVNGLPYSNRLYSIVSTQLGEGGKSNLAVCVKRVVSSVETGQRDLTKQGVCSNYLCDALAGHTVRLTGPHGKTMLLPKISPLPDLVMVATGTGVAPFRAFSKAVYIDSTELLYPSALLIIGAPSRDSILYGDLWKSLSTLHPTNFNVHFALSREEKDSQGGKVYVQNKIEELCSDIYGRIDNGAHIYFCGTRAMMPAILSIFQSYSARNGITWTDKLNEWKSKGQWHVEVY